MKDKLRAVFVPIASVVIGIIVGALIMWLFRYDAVKGYEALFNGHLVNHSILVRLYGLPLRLC